MLAKAIVEKETEVTTTIAKEAKTTSKENPWVSGVIKGKIAETIVEELFRSVEFQVFSYGMETLFQVLWWKNQEH